MYNYHPVNIFSPLTGGASCQFGFWRQKPSRLALKLSFLTNELALECDLNIESGGSPYLVLNISD